MSKDNIIIEPLTAAIIVYVNTGEMPEEYRKQYESRYGESLPTTEEIKIKFPKPFKTQ
jgi:hypothetical protein